MTDGERALAFTREVYRRRAERVDPFPWGELVSTPSLPKIWDANLAVVDRWEGTPGELHEELERVQAAAGFGHRKTSILDEALAGRIWPALAEPDWTLRGRYLFMAQRREADRPTDPSVRVEEVTLDRIRTARAEETRSQPYGGDEEVVRDLLELDRRLAAALDVRFVAALVDGQAAAYASVYLDGGVGQIEDVGTVEAYRGRGLARAAVLCGAALARDAGASLVYLIADEADWPKELYGRLGFDTVAVEHLAGRPGYGRLRATSCG